MLRLFCFHKIRSWEILRKCVCEHVWDNVSHCLLVRGNERKGLSEHKIARCNTDNVFISIPESRLKEKVAEKTDTPQVKMQWFLVERDLHSTMRQ